MQENTTETVVKGARSTFWIMFFFMLLHQADKLLIGPLTTQIMDSFKISYTHGSGHNWRTDCGCYLLPFMGLAL